MNNQNNYVVILAGGIGTRLWPSSRTQKPKQFLDILGTGSTMLQTTYERYAEFVPKENIIVVSNEMYEDLTRQQLPSLPQKNLLLEPIRRNTVPSVTWAAMHVYHRNPNALMLISPADQMITDYDALKQDIMAGFKYVEENQRLLTLGITPTRPETTFGYIQMADQMADNIFKVKSFTEKPEIEFANLFYESNEFLWNTGLFMWAAKTYLDAIRGMSDDFTQRMEALKDHIKAGSPLSHVIDDAFSISPSIPLETGVLEKVNIVDVMLCHFGWRDLGTWSEVFNVIPKEKNNNAVISANALFYDSEDCVVKLPEGKIAVIQGLKDYVVVEEDNVLMICKKDDQQAIRHFVNDVQINMGDDFL